MTDPQQSEPEPDGEHLDTIDPDDVVDPDEFDDAEDDGG